MVNTKKTTFKGRKNLFSLTSVLLAVMIAVFSAICFTGCGGTENEVNISQENLSEEQFKELIAGTWVYDNSVEFVFNSDGTGTSAVLDGAGNASFDFTYTVVKGEGASFTVTVTNNGSGDAMPYTAELSGDGESLNLINNIGNARVFEKQ